MRGAKVLFGISCGILLLVALFTALGALESLGNAFGRRPETVGTVTMDQIKSLGGDESLNAFKARRATAATWALGFAILFGWVVFDPYRRGNRWAWWALLVSLGLPQLISLARVPLLGTTSGVAPSATALAFLLIGLLAGVPRIFIHSVKL
jgi:hypothetical protein